tara:strand:+ start:2919 stop:3995 length:1077 start_codon:yes stop_codon:yes gene_type:complete
MNRIIAVEDAVGETRAAVIEDGRVMELHVERWSDLVTRAIAGAVYAGRVRRVDGSLNAAFIDLGIGEDGFMPFGKAGRPKGLHEGAAWKVAVAREAFGEKGPTLKSLDGPIGDDAPALLEDAGSLADRLAARFPDATGMWADETEVDIGEVIDETLAVSAPIPGGGQLIIEPTAALTAIDVDAAGRVSTGGAEKLAGDLNRSAAKEAARQIRLRGLGGVVAVDFVHMRDRKQRTEIEQILRRAFKRDTARVDVAPMSPFGIVELARQRTGRNLSEILLDESGQKSVETCALDALKRLEDEARSVRARRATLRLSVDAAQWLSTHDELWRPAMTERLGPRFTVESVEDWPRDKADVVMS